MATVSGQSYAVSFDLVTDGGRPSSVVVLLGGVSLFSLTNPPAAGLAHHTFDVTASSANELLSFAFRDDPGFELLDNVSVTSVPEPATWAMMLLGAGLAGAVLRRRRAVVPA